MGLLSNLSNFWALYRQSVDTRPVKGELISGAAITLGELGEVWRGLERTFTLRTDRLGRYREYDQMLEGDLVEGTVEAYATESGQRDEIKGLTVWVTSKDAKVQGFIERLFERISLEDTAHGMLRGIVSHGDDFNIIVGSTERGVEFLCYDKPEKFECDLDEFNKVKGYKYGVSLDTNLNPWEVIHFKYPGTNRISPYGTAILERLRLPYLRTRLIEDGALFHALKQSPGRDVWEVMCNEGMSLNKCIERVRQVMNAVKYKRKLDVGDNRFQVTSNPMGWDDDIFIPRMGDKVLYTVNRQDPSNATMDVSLLEYYVKRYCAAAFIPPSFFGFELGAPAFDSSKSLAQQDARFARKCKPVQRALLQGLARLAMIQLCYQSLDPKITGNEFSLHMMPVSFLDEQQRQEIYAMKIETMDNLRQFGVDAGLLKKEWLTFIMRDIGGFSPIEIDKWMSDMGELQGAESLSNGEKKLLRELYNRGAFARLWEGVGCVYHSTELARTSVPSKLPPLEMLTEDRAEIIQKVRQEVAKPRIIENNKKA